MSNGYLIDNGRALEQRVADLETNFSSLSAQVDDSLVLFEYKKGTADLPQTVVAAGATETLKLSTDTTPSFLFRTASGNWAMSDEAITIPEAGFYRVFLTGTMVTVVGASLDAIIGAVFNGVALTNVFTALRVAAATEPVSFTMTWIQRAIPAGDVSWQINHDSVSSATFEPRSLVIAARLATREELSVGNP